MGKGILELKLLDAKGLQKNTDLIGKVDPYVLIQYRGQEHKSKIARGQGGSPTWNETFRFLVRSPAAADHHQQQQHKVTLRVMDHDTFTADDFLGEATIFVGDVIARGVEEGAAELQTAKYRVVLADRRYCGEIRASVTFTNQEIEEKETEEEEYGGWKHSFIS